MVKNDIDRIKDEIESLRKRLADEREKYKKLVNELYEKEKPFPGRPDSDEGFQDDIKKFWELIEYSLIVGDTEILERWAINPLVVGKLSLSKSNHPEYYSYVFTKTKVLEKEIMANKFGKALVEQLVKALKKNA